MGNALRCNGLVKPEEAAAAVVVALPGAVVGAAVAGTTGGGEKDGVGGRSAAGVTCAPPAPDDAAAAAAAAAAAPVRLPMSTVDDVARMPTADPAVPDRCTARNVVGVPGALGGLLCGMGSPDSDSMLPERSRGDAVDAVVRPARGDDPAADDAATTATTRGDDTGDSSESDVSEPRVVSEPRDASDERGSAARGAPMSVRRIIVGDNVPPTLFAGALGWRRSSGAFFSPMGGDIFRWLSDERMTVFVFMRDRREIMPPPASLRGSSSCERAMSLLSSPNSVESSRMKL